MKRLITGNEAVALGALRAGVRVVTGYPGTPSTGALTSLLDTPHEGVYVEWSTNEKVAFEVAAGAAWAGQSAMVTMKMSGLNVAADSLLSVAYSGVEGALVIFVADDPGVSAGCVEQDSRAYAAMADLPLLEPSSVAETYGLAQRAFELSGKVKCPVFLRLVTAISNSYAVVDVDDFTPAPVQAPRLIKDINRFTKAGAQICTDQHRAAIHRLEQAGQAAREMDLNRLRLATQPGGLGVIAAGSTAVYLDEACDKLMPYGLERDALSIFEVHATYPFPLSEAQALLRHCGQVVVLEELEPFIERQLMAEAYRMGYSGRISGKLDGVLSRTGDYGLGQVVTALAQALNISLPENALRGDHSTDGLAAARPITVCAGCPHRGTYMAINQAIKKLKYKPGQVVVTGDIGCTILGMNAPFDTVWTEVSMGASVSLAQGYVHAGVKTPVIATIGDSTFFHGGIPGLINAVQHQADLTLIIMDNLWTAMTGMQTNPGTPCEFQESTFRNVDIARIVPALGVDQFFVVDPFDLETSSAVIQKAMQLQGVKVVLARRECAIQSGRRQKNAGSLHVVAENCNLCKLCIMVTGCSALEVGQDSVMVDSALCRLCGLCVEVCNRDALRLEIPERKEAQP